MFIVFHILDYFPRPGPQSIPQGGIQTEVDPSLKIEFVKKPPDDIFCPVTTTPLLVPHLTSCCGQHLSEEAADRIKHDGRACPLCNTPSWSTLLNRHFQRKICELRVFCPRKMRGCRWEGELGALHRHEQSCASKTSPLETHSQVSNQEQVCPMHISHCTHVCAASKTSNCLKLQYFLFFIQKITLLFTIFPTKKLLHFIILISSIIII